MTPQEAIKILDDVTSQVTAQRNVHAEIMKALQTLRAAIEPPEPPIPPQPTVTKAP